MVTSQPARQQSYRPRIWPQDTRQAAVVVGVFVVLLYALEILDALLPANLDAFGIIPRETSGLDGILFAPVLHAGFAHLIANTLPVLILGFLAFAGGVRQWVAVTALVWVGGGIAVWLIARDGVHLGASGLVFGWLGFLLARGFFARSAKQIALAVVLFLAYGGALFGVLPLRADVSWEGHLFGVVAGLLAAVLVASADRSEV